MEHLNPDRFVIKCLRGRLCVFLSFIWTVKIPQIVVALTENLLIETIVFSTIALLYINGMSKLLGFYNFMYPFCVDEAMGNGIRYCPCSLSVIPAGWVVPYSIFFQSKHAVVYVIILTQIPLPQRCGACILKVKPLPQSNRYIPVSG